MTLASIHPTGIAAYAGNGSVRKGEAQRNRQAETSGQVARGAFVHRAQSGMCALRRAPVACRLSPPSRGLWRPRETSFCVM